MAVTEAHRDVERQKGTDRVWGEYQGVLVARITAVVGAQQALARGEYAGVYVLRQALVDLAAVYELLADLFGRRRAFFVGSALFAGFSLLGGVAQDAPWLIAARVGMGSAAR